MEFVMKYFYSLIILTFLTACGGGSGGESQNTVAPTIDGPKVLLAETDDSFIQQANENSKLDNVTATEQQKFVASKQVGIALNFMTTDCYINIYNRYEMVKGEVAPDQNSRVLQLSSTDCSYSGPISVVSQQREVLIEIIKPNSAPQFFSSDLDTMVLTAI